MCYPNCPPGYSLDPFKQNESCSPLDELCPAFPEPLSTCKEDGYYGDGDGPDGTFNWRHYLCQEIETPDKWKEMCSWNADGNSAGGGNQTALQEVKEGFADGGPDGDCLFNPSLPKCASDNGECPDGFFQNEGGNCFPQHDRCPEGYHGHEDDETGRCIPDSVPCEPGYTRDPDFPTCSREHFTCDGKPSVVKCEDDDNGDDERHKVIIITNKIDIHKTVHNTKDFPDVDIIGLSIKDNGDAIVCMMNIDEDWVQCQEFGVPDDRINEDVWRVIEADSDKDYDNGNTGSDDVDDAIDAIKGHYFNELEELDNHDFNVDLAALGINTAGDGLICLIKDRPGTGTALCEPFKVSTEAISGQITEITEFS